MSLTTPVIKHASGIEWTGRCSAWCASSSDGGLPTPGSIAFISETDGKDLASYSQNELEQGSHIPWVEGGDDNQPSQFISMGSVNKVIGLGQDISCTRLIDRYNDKTLCEQVKKLIWSGRELCDFSITCRSFSPEGCSRFGIEVYSTAANGSHEICFNNQVVNMALHPQDTVDLRIWSDQATMSNVSCLAWCGRLNELPVKTATFTSDAVREDLYNAALNDTNPSKFG